MAFELKNSDLKRVRSVVDTLVDDLHLPGMSVGIVSGKNLVFAEGFGYADIESKRNQSPSLRQRIGSITKTMVSICAMALVDEGRLTLDDKVVERLPDITFNGPANNLTIRHLMTHTGGIGEAPTMANITNPYDALWSDTPDIIPISKAYPEGINIESIPGTKWAYANHGFGLLGEIIERIEGVSIERVLKDRIFDPLGMKDTDCYDRPHPDLSTGYHRVSSIDELDLLDIIGEDPPVQKTVDGYNIRGRYVYVKPRAAGAVESTIADMALYSSAVLSGGGGIVKPETLELMLSPQWRPDPRLSNMGITFSRGVRFGHQVYSHGGGIAGGWNTQFIIIPDLDLGLLLHINLWSDLTEMITSRVLKAVLNATHPIYKDIKPDPDMLLRAPGVYEPVPGHLTNHRTTTNYGRIQITVKDGDLYIRSRRGAWREGLKLIQRESNDPTFYTIGTDQIERPGLLFVGDNKGEISEIHFDRLTHMIRNEVLNPWV